MWSKKRRISKKKALRRHAKTRLRQRFKICLNRKQYREIVRAIGGREFECIGRQSYRVTVHRGKILGQTVIVIYDGIRHEIITVLTEEQYNQGNNREGTIEKQEDQAGQP